MIVVAPNGAIRMSTGRARELMTRYFGDHRDRAAALPAELARWTKVTAATAGADGLPGVRRPLVVDRSGRQLTVHLVSHAGDVLLLLEEASQSVSASELEPLGLTRREAQVLAWIAEGKTNTEIAALMGNSRRTIEKHLEHIYVKLAVETRTAAAARVLGFVAAPSRLAERGPKRVA